MWRLQRIRGVEHLVDAVIMLDGDRHGTLRTLRAVKNRFGSTDELGLLEMGEKGLAGIEDPGRAFIDDRDERAPGAVVAPLLEGSRPMLVEVQALVAGTAYGTPRRTGRGLDTARLSLLSAVLARRAGIPLGDRDIYANLVGGIVLDEPALDLPLALALASSQSDRPISRTLVAVGEVGLLGELRPVSGLARRLREAARLEMHVAEVIERQRRPRRARRHRRPRSAAGADRLQHRCSRFMAVGRRTELPGRASEPWSAAGGEYRCLCDDALTLVRKDDAMS